MRALSIGEILWDLLPDGKHLGGAPFNFGVNLHRLGHEVLFATALGDDPLGREAREKMRAAGIDMRLVETSGRYPTGTVDVALDASGEPRYRIHRPAAYDDWMCDGTAGGTLAAFDAQWIYFGTLLAYSAEGRRAVESVLEACPHASRFYDVNLRQDSYSRVLVEHLLRLAGVVKMNDGELGPICAWLGIEEGDDAGRAARLGAAMGWRALAVTRGENGCLIWTADGAADHAGFRVTTRDTVGAGDAFAAGFLHGLDRGWPLARVAEFANRLGAVTAAHSGATPEWSMEEAERLK
ncbi:MAG: carbohydrate kinase family protein [Bryobacteraceae bacterium]